MSESSKGVLLIVDDEPLKRVTLQIELSQAGYTALDVSDATSALQQLRSRPVDVVLTDLRMPGADGLELLEQAKAISPRTHVIMMTAYASVDSAVDAMKRGAVDYLAKPFQTKVLLEKLDCLRSSQHWMSRHETSTRVDRVGSLVGQSYAARCLFEQIRSVANHDKPVLIQGESGTGKGSVANAIHELSGRAQQPLVSLVCIGRSPATMDAELFGSHVSSTGLGVWQPGRLEAADASTLFLDQVDALSIESQLKLLRFLERHEIERDGGASRLALDVRLLCATNRNLRPLVDAGQFREDLYYRLSAVKVVVPPLRDRREDIPLIVEQLLRANQADAATGSGHDGRLPRIKVSPHTMEKLMTYHWPSNIRELEHAVERAIASVSASCAGSEGSSVEIASKDILLEYDRRSVWGEDDQEMACSDREEGSLPSVGQGLTETIAGVESSLINAALRRAAGNQAKAAQFLGIPRTTLRDKIAKYGMAIGKREDVE